MRAESLARYYSKHYPRVILGGPPRRPKAQHFAGVLRVAVFGGEKEDTRDMLGGTEDLIAAGERAHFSCCPASITGISGAKSPAIARLRRSWITSTRRTMRSMLPRRTRPCNVDGRKAHGRRWLEARMAS